jgi:hypothetical protein
MGQAPPRQACAIRVTLAGAFGCAPGAPFSSIGKGLGETVSKGAEGAGEALGKTWDALTMNEDLKKGVEFCGKAAWVDASMMCTSRFTGGNARWTLFFGPRHCFY